MTQLRITLAYPQSRITNKKVFFSFSGDFLPKTTINFGFRAIFRTIWKINCEIRVRYVGEESFNQLASWLVVYKCSRWSGGGRRYVSRVEAPAALSALLISGRAADNDALSAWEPAAAGAVLADRGPSSPHVRQRVSTLLGANLGVSPHRRPSALLTVNIKVQYSGWNADFLFNSRDFMAN